MVCWWAWQTQKIWDYVVWIHWCLEPQDSGDICSCHQQWPSPHWILLPSTCQVVWRNPQEDINWSRDWNNPHGGPSNKPDSTIQPQIYQSYQVPPLHQKHPQSEDWMSVVPANETVKQWAHQQALPCCWKGLLQSWRLPATVSKTSFIVNMPHNTDPPPSPPGYCFSTFGSPSYNTVWMNGQTTTTHSSAAWTRRVCFQAVAVQIGATYLEEQGGQMDWCPFHLKRPTRYRHHSIQMELNWWGWHHFGSQKQ